MNRFTSSTSVTLAILSNISLDISEIVSFSYSPFNTSSAAPVDALQLTRFRLWRHFWGSFLMGVYLPQKTDLVFPLESERNSFQGHVSFYILNRIPVMAPILATLIGVHFLSGCFSLKNRSYRPLLRASTSPFKSTCLLIRLKEVSDALYGPHLHC
jgi:hypothetical protein